MYFKKPLSADAGGSQLTSAFWDTWTGGTIRVVTVKLGKGELNSGCILYIKSTAEFLK